MNIVAEVEAEESALDRVDGAEDTSRQQFVGKRAATSSGETSSVEIRENRR